MDPSKVSVVALGPVTLECEGKLYMGTERATCTPTDPQPMDVFLCIYLPNASPELDPRQCRSAHSYQTFQGISFLPSPLTSISPIQVPTFWFPSPKLSHPSQTSKG